MPISACLAHRECSIACVQSIWNENIEFLWDKNIFDFNYLTFVWNLTHLPLPGKPARRWCLGRFIAYDVDVRAADGKARNQELPRVSFFVLEPATHAGCSPARFAWFLSQLHRLQVAQLVTTYVFKVSTSVLCHCSPLEGSRVSLLLLSGVGAGVGQRVVPAVARIPQAGTPLLHATLAACCRPSSNG